MGVVKISKTFTATGDSESALISGGRGALTIRGDGGPFVGTIQVRRYKQGDSKAESIVVESYTVDRAATMAEHVGAIYFFRCSAYTSGSIKCEIEQ